MPLPESTLLATQLVSSLAGVLLVVPIYLIGRSLFGRNVGLMTARTGKLLDLYGTDVLAKTVTDVLACGLHDPGALALRCEQARRAAGAPMPVTLELGAHVPDCDVIPHDLGKYDRPRSAS